MLYNDPTNEGRAARIDEVREAYWNARCEVEDDVEEFVADLLADIMHFCDREGVDFQARLRTAESNHEAEFEEG